MPNRYYWLKLKQDFFNSVRIKKLRSLAGGDTFTIIYLKMLLSSMCDGGVIYFQNVEENISEEIALLINENADNVAVTVNYLLKVGLAEVSENGLLLPEVDEMTGTESESAERVRRHRLTVKALHCNADVTECNADVTRCNTEIEKEKEKKREELDKNRERKEYCASDEAKEVIDWLNHRAGTRYKYSKSACSHINARLKEGFTVQDCKDVIDKKCTEWMGTEMEKYIRPETLFGSKFENYLNARITNKRKELAF